MDVLQKMECVVPQIVHLFARVNREKVRPAYEKQMEIVEKIKQIEKTVSKSDNERSGDGKTANNK